MRLIKGESLELIESNGMQYRKAIRATFLHNGTTLFCDTALWNIDNKMIYGNGNVKISQDDMTLTSEKLEYNIDENLARFSGVLVQLCDKKNNILRSHNLDYNTKDSVAVFTAGGAMRSEDGQIIESYEGVYDSKLKLFSFTGNVNMFSDSVFVKSDHIDYHTDSKIAYFLSPVDFWKEDDMLSSDSGWYDRDKETFFFEGRVHGQTKDQEAWSDSLFFYRRTNNVLMLGRAQMQDPGRNLIAVADRIFYEDSLACLTMTEQAAVAIETEHDNKKDTLFGGADKIIYQTVKMCDIDSTEIAAASARLEELMADPVNEYRRKAAKEAAEAAKKESAESPNRFDRPNEKVYQRPDAALAELRRNREKLEREMSGADKPVPPSLYTEDEMPPAPGQEQGEVPPGDEMPSDSAQDGLPPGEEIPSDSGQDGVSDEGEAPSEAGQAQDSLAVEGGALPLDAENIAAADGKVDTSMASVADTLRAKKDTIAVPTGPLDTTKVGFLLGLGDVRVFREDMQMRCDSLRYSDLDSVARFYVNPMIWNEGTRQYSSDSLYTLISNGYMERASLMSNAMVISQSDTAHYDQIRGTEIMAYFNEQSELRRFDALGGANTIFFLEEKDTLATVNKVEAKMLSAVLVDGAIDRVYYFDNPKNDAYPLLKYPRAEKFMKGFNWDPERRPKRREDVTTLKVKPSQRDYYSSKPRATFTNTDRYFPGYMESVYGKIAESRIRRQERERLDAERREKEKSAAAALSDSLALKDSLGVRDSLALKDSLAQRDTSAMSDSRAADAPQFVDAAFPLVDIPVTDDTLAVSDSIPLSSPDSTAATSPATAAAIANVAKSSAEKAQKRMELLEQRMLERQAKREERWAELDLRDSRREAAKEARKLHRRRERVRRALIASQKQQMQERRKLERYVARLQKKKEREDRRKLSE